MARPVLSVRLPFGDTTFTKIFVGGLAWETQSSGLGRRFEQYGEILEAVVITDKKTGRSKGYGFVTFRYPDAARRACLDPNPVIDGRRANCNLASLGRSQPPTPAGNTHSGDIYIGGFQAPQQYGRLSYLQSFPYGCPQGLLYCPYGYATYGAEYLYSHGHGPPVAYSAHQYPQIYGRNVQLNSSAYPFILPNHSFSSGYGYDPQQWTGVPDQNLHLFSPQDVSSVSTTQPYKVVHSTRRSPSASTSSSQSTVPAHGEHVQGATRLNGNVV